MTTMDVRGRLDLSVHGIHPTGDVLWNPTTSVLYEHAVKRGEGRIGEGGPLVVDTGKHTGRSPKDKFVVREPSSERRIWWGGNNELDEESFEKLRDKVVSFLDHRQDDAVGRPGAPSDRRRRTRLGRSGRLQLRRRLLREDDPSLPRRGAGDLEGVAQLRDDPREHRDRRVRRARSRRRLEDGE